MIIHLIYIILIRQRFKNNNDKTKTKHKYCFSISKKDIWQKELKIKMPDDFTSKD